MKRAYLVAFIVASLFLSFISSHAEEINLQLPRAKARGLPEVDTETPSSPPLRAGFSSGERIKPKSLESIEFLAGFGWGKLRATDNYNLYPIIASFDFSLKPILEKFNIWPRQLAQFQVEPFISPVSSPNRNIEAGASLFFKLGLLPQSSKFQPYAKVGAGIVYMSQHTREQATQYNFIEQLGAGFHYFFNKNTAFTLEGRLRHLSNAGIDHPNQGINTYFVVTGITYLF